MKMTEDQAYFAVGRLAGGCRGWKEASTDVFVDQFQKLVDDPEAMTEVCERLAVSWREAFPPALGDVMREYHAHPRVAADREARVAGAMLDETGSAHGVTYSEGWAIARDAYRSAYGREMGEKPVPNPEYAETLIINCKRRDRAGNWLARYVDVLNGFNGDQARAGASLEAIGRRLTRHRMTGALTLRPPEPPQAPPAPPQAATPSSPPERTTDASGLLSEAIGATIKRMEGQ